MKLVQKVLTVSRKHEQFLEKMMLKYKSRANAAEAKAAGLEKKIRMSPKTMEIPAPSPLQREIVVTDFQVNIAQPDPPLQSQVTNYEHFLKI